MITCRQSGASAGKSVGSKERVVFYAQTKCNSHGDCIIAIAIAAAPSYVDVLMHGRWDAALTLCAFKGDSMRW